MVSSFANWTRRWLLAGAAAAAMWLPGTRTAGQGAQPILFSSPDSDTITSNLPSLTPKAPDLSSFSAENVAPLLNFGASPSAASASAPPAPVPAPPLSPAAAERLQTLLDRRNNWTLLTPAEILNVPTPEKILGIREHDGNGLSLNESVVGRYYKRQESLRGPGTNELAGYGFTRPADAFGSPTSQWTSAWSPGLWTSPDNNPFKPSALGQWPAGAAANSFGFNPKPDAGWAGWFNPPAAQPSGRPVAQPTGQPVALDPLQQLLTPRSTSTDAGTGAGAKPFSQPQTASDVFSGKSLLNPVGAPLPPLSGAVGAPIGATPLPGILGPTNQAALLVPNWKPELPPWMSRTPQPGTIPQRKF